MSVSVFVPLFALARRLNPASPRVLALRAAVLLAAALAGCAPLRPVERTPSQALAVHEATPLGDAVAAQAVAHPDESGFRLLTRGNEALVAREALALSARRTLDLQYYIIHDDASSRALLRLVAQAAERGVRVRVLLDDVHTDNLDDVIAAFAARPNIDVRVFNPFSVRGTMGVWRTVELLTHTDRLNRRMHNKMMVADNAAAIVGGRNLGNEYFGAVADTSFVDLDVLAVGPVVRQASDSFDAYWNSPWAVPIEAIVAPPESEPPLIGASAVPAPAATRLSDALLAGTLAFDWGRAEALWDRPDKISGQAAAAQEGVRMEPVIRQMIREAREQVTLVSAYFVPGERGVAQLSALVQRGVGVRVVTNSLAATDVLAVHGGYAHYRTDLARAGVQLFELRPLERPPEDDSPRSATGSGPFRSRTSLHAKTLVLDGRTVVIGSSNADPRSSLLNTEMVFVIHSASLARTLSGLIDEVVAARCHRVVWTGNGIAWERDEGGHTLRLEKEPDSTAWQRLLSGVLWTVAPESFL